MPSGLKGWYFYNSELISLVAVAGTIFGLIALGVWYAYTDDYADWAARSNMDRAGERAAELAVEYERLARVASLHEHTGDDWMASVAHGHAAKTARAAAERLSIAGERMGTAKSDWGGTVAPEIRAAAANAEAEWLSIEAASWDRAAGAAADAGRDRMAAAWAANAAHAHAMAEELYADAQLAEAGMDASEMQGVLDALDALDNFGLP